MAVSLVTLLLVLALIGRFAEPSSERAVESEVADQAASPSSEPAAIALRQSLMRVDRAISAFQNYNRNSVRDGSAYWFKTDPITSDCSEARELGLACIEHMPGSWVIDTSAPPPPLAEEMRSLSVAARELEEVAEAHRWPNDANAGMPSHFAVERYMDALDDVVLQASTIKSEAVGHLGGGYPDHTESKEKIQKRIDQWMPFIDEHVATLDSASAVLREELNLA